MIAHIVLFRPRATLEAADRETFLQAMETALAKISVIKRARVGRRVVMGRPYDAGRP